MKHRFKYFFAGLIFVFSCKNLVNSVQNGDLRTKFLLKNNQGSETTQFQFGEDIFFSYSIENQSADNLPYLNQNSGPFVVFEVYSGGSLVGTSTDGLAFLPVVVADTLKVGESLSLEYGWLSTPSHNPLPVGVYKAVARPILKFNDSATPEPEEIAFRVQAAVSESVIITDRAPADIQLDPFVLNSAQISADSIRINLSYGGGCKIHNFELYMSPAAFMESNPVQANLFLRHNGNGDLCKAIITEKISISLKPVAELYQKFYGRKDEIILNLFKYFEGPPAEHLSLSYLP